MCENCCCKCPVAALLNDPENLKAKLVANERYVRAVQGIFLFRLIPQYVAIFAFVNILFIIIGKFDLSPLAVLTLFAILYNLVKLAWQLARDQIVNFFFPQEFDQGTNENTNRVRSAEEIATLLTTCPCLAKCRACQATKEEGLPVKKIAILSGLFVLFCITGTFWLNFVVVNLILILPGVLLLPQVNPTVVQIKNQVFPPKEKTD